MKGWELKGMTKRISLSVIQFLPLKKLSFVAMHSALKHYAGRRPTSA